MDTTVNEVVDRIEIRNASLVAVTREGRFAYVSGGGSVTAIDTSSNATVATIPLPNVGVIVSGPDEGSRGPFLYASIDRGIAVIDSQSNTVVDMISLDTSPKVIAVSPDGSLLYASDTEFSSGVGEVYAVNLGTKELIESITSSVLPAGIAFSPDSTLAYVVLGGKASLAVMDAPSAVTLAEIPLPPGPFGPTYFGLALSPDGRRAFVVPFFNLQSCAERVLAVDLETRSIDERFSGTLPCFLFSPAPKLAPDGGPLYVPFLL